ncbi:helix-turn-helix domain-containing protein [Bailinhaonella thermotolerans]|uniref:Helix-turn-helix domain-containing protein n=1 Tax=Bailinhaonella thermotolerans TaxID=1070861 RepID=A0A3A4AV88_9ACTN|nr:helix-turn-helix domain-containing protein [Bailinhaonella thermotolerans]RJL33525.1 helix-turn-helix domain-containing protein [Bailinhaonella thermotolerans]
MRVDTTLLPPRDQADRWRAAVAAAFGPLEVRPLDGPGFPGALVGRALGPVTVSEVRAPAHEVRRAARHTGRGQGEYYKLGLMLEGSCALEQSGRYVVARPGDVVIYDVARPVEITFEAHRLLTVMVPHGVLPLPAGRVAELTGTLLPGPGSGRPVAAFLRSLAEDPAALDGPAAHHLGEAVLSLVTGAIAERTGAPQAPCPGPPFPVIESWIEDHLGDPALTPAVVARAHHISVRQLYRVFQAQGRTVAAHIRSRRLERCRRDLLTRPDPVAVIAARWCFPDPAGFSRAFRRAYGLSPAAYRATAGR